MVIGDWGRDGAFHQRQVATAMAQFRNARFVASTGDNFYQHGISSLRDPKWETSFQRIYEGVPQRWYAVLGNHDYGGRVEAQIAKTFHDDRWRMPDYWFDVRLDAYGRRDAHLFFINTVAWRGKEKFPYPAELDIEVEKIYEFKAGSKLFMRPRFYKIWQTKLKQYEKRTQDYYLEVPITKSDTTAFHLAEGYTVEALPKDKSISFAKGKYESKYWYDEASRTIFSTAKLTVTSQVIEPAIYEEARLFFDQVIDDTNQKVVCKKTN